MRIQYQGRNKTFTCNCLIVWMCFCWTITQKQVRNQVRKSVFWRRRPHFVRCELIYKSLHQLGFFLLSIFFSDVFFKKKENHLFSQFKSSLCPFVQVRSLFPSPSWSGGCIVSQGCSRWPWSWSVSLVGPLCGPPGPSVVATSVGPHLCHLWINQQFVGPIRFKFTDTFPARSFVRQL